LRASPGGDSGNFRLCRVCRYLAEENTGRRQNVFRLQMKPHGSCGSFETRWFPDWLKTLGCRSDASWFAKTPRT